MAELDAYRTSPLAGLEQEMRDAAVTGPHAVTMREVPFLTQIGIRADPAGAAHAALAAATGVGLPGQAGAVAGSPDGTAVLWLAPDEFLLITASAEAAFTARLRAALGDRRGQVVDLSSARAVLELAGPGAREVLESAVLADIDPRAFAPGAARTTLLGTVPIILWCAGTDRHLVLVRTSFARHVARWLLDAMQELG